METKYDVLIPGQPAETRTADLPAEPTWDQIKAVIQPIIGEKQNAEHVTILLDGKRSDMFVDEDGHAFRLPHNPAATEHYRRNWLTQHPEQDPETLPFIVGPAIVFHRRIWF